MKAVTYHQYGTVDVLNLEEVPKPTPKEDEVLIKVRAASVTTADWRIRALEMPGAMRIIGRLLFGVFGPRNKILGTDIAGDVVAVGERVSKFNVGDSVFGYIGKGGHAEYAIAHEDVAIISKPNSLPYHEAAALPFGGLSALVFLREFAELQSGQRVLIIGASGNVGAYAVQIAKAFGAHVTAVASRSSSKFVSSLGVDEFVDYQTTKLGSLENKFDVVFDTYGAMSFEEAKGILTDNGLFLPLNFSLGNALTNLLTGWLWQQKMVTAVNRDTSDDLQELLNFVQDDKLKPIIDRTFRLAEIRAAYTYVERRSRKGSVVISI